MTTHPRVIVAGRVYTPAEVSQDGYEIRLVVGGPALSDFVWERPCPQRGCHRGLLPCCGHCAAEGHDERCQSEDALAILAKMRGR